MLGARLRLLLSGAIAGRIPAGGTGALPLAKAWDLISAAPARRRGLSDRGVLAQGYRADIILVDDGLPLRPRIVAVIAAGRLVHLTEANRLHTRHLDVSFQEVVHSVLTGNAEVARHKRFAENRMDSHKNARLTPKGREAMVRSVVDGGLSRAAAARQFNTSAKTVAKWVDRFRRDGVEGLRDHSSRPHSSPNQTPLAVRANVEGLRRQRYTGKQIAVELGLSAATVSRILQRLGLNRIRALEPCRAGAPL